MSVVLDRNTLSEQLRAAREAQAAAEQAVNDAVVALRMAPWGKITKLTWSAEWESDDQGGSYISTSSFNIRIDGNDIPLGYSLDDGWDDFWSDIDFEDDTDEVVLLVKKYQLAGMEDDDELIMNVLAELADLTMDELNSFLKFAEECVDDDKELGELRFGGA